MVSPQIIQGIAEAIKALAPGLNKSLGMVSDTIAEFTGLAAKQAERAKNAFLWSQTPTAGAWINDLNDRNQQKEASDNQFIIIIFVLLVVAVIVTKSIKKTK